MLAYEQTGHNRLFHRCTLRLGLDRTTPASLKQSNGLRRVLETGNGLLVKYHMAGQQFAKPGSEFNHLSGFDM